MVERDRSRNRRTFLKTVGAGGAAALAGCLGGSGDGDDGSGGGETPDTTAGGGATTTTGSSGSPAEVVFLHDRDQGKETIDAMAQEFNDAHPNIEVKPQLTPSGTGTTEQIQKMRAAGKPPEVIWFTFGQAYRFAREGNLASITDVVEENDLRTFTDTDEKFFAPMIVGPITWHYRTDYYDTPQTWGAYLDQAPGIQEGNDITPLQIPNGETTLADSLQYQMLWDGDVNIWDGPSDDIQLSMATGEDREKAISVYETMQDLYEYSVNGNGLGWVESAQAYAQGSAATVPYIGQWIPTLYLKDSPEIKENTFNGFHPTMEGAQNQRQFAWYEGTMVWDTENNDAAREWVSFFSGNDGIERFIGENAGDYLPARERDMTADWYINNDAVYRPLVELFAENAQHITPPVATGTDGALNFPAVSNGLLFGQAAAQLLTGNKSPAETIDWLADQFGY